MESIDLKDNRKIAIYSRKSKFTGKGESTHNQIEACKRKIDLTFDNINFENDVIIYEDEGFTGYNTNRPAFQKLLNDIRNKEIKALVFYKLDRVSRNVSDFSILVTELDNYNVSFVSATESIENVTPAGRAMMFMISVFAQLERDTIAERIRDNMLELAKTGRWLGGVVPTGYKSEQIEKINIDGKKRKLYKLSQIDEEALIIKILFNKMKELKSQTKLETYTILNNIKTKNGKQYTRWALKNILTNPVYAMADHDTLKYFKNYNIDIYADEADFNGTHGLMVYNKTEKKNNRIVKKNYKDWIVSIGKHKGIISGKEWVEVQNILEVNKNMKYRKPNASTNCILSGLLHCAHCDSFMRAKMKNKTIDNLKRRRFDYICELKDKSKKQKCQCKNIDGLEADDLVLAEIKSIPIPISKIYKALKKKSANTFNNKNNEEIKLLKKIISKNKTDITLLLNKIKYIDISLINDISNEINILKEKNIELENKIREVNSDIYNELSEKELNNMQKNILNNYLNSFDLFDLNSKKNMIKQLVNSIISDSDTLIINFFGAGNTNFFPKSDNCK